MTALVVFLFVRNKDQATGAPDEVAVADEREQAPRTRPDNDGTDHALAPIWTQASGQVSASAGEAIAGAVVTLAPLGDDAGEPRTTRTDASGDWVLEQLPAGRYTLSATAPGYLAAVRPALELHAKSDNSSLDLTLEPGGATLSGVVSDKTGGVIEGALVQLTPQSGIVRMRERESYFTITDEQGRYAVQVPTGRSRVRASHTDYSSEAVVVEFTTEPRTQNFALVPTAVIEGLVVRESDGQPVPYAEVTWFKERSLMLPSGDEVTTIGRGGKVTASDSGAFRISGLPPGMIALEARASRLASFDATQVSVGIAERVADVELRLAAASDISGKVVAASDGEGIAGAGVELNSQMGTGGRARSDEDGRFTVLGVLPGRYRVVADASGWTQPDGPPPSIEIGDGRSATVEVVLERGLSIRGRVEPATEAEVAIEIDTEKLGVGGGMRGLTMVAPTRSSADNGSFELTPVKPGHYTLQARTADGRGGTVEVDVGADGVEDVVIALDQRATLAGRVEDYTGKVVTDVTVRARKQQAKNTSVNVIVNGRELTALSAPTTTEGRFEVAGLEQGAWVVEVVDANGEPLMMEGGERLDVSLAKAETRELLLRVEPRDGRICGVVNDAEGHAVADAWVSAAYVAAPKTRPQPDPEGEEGEQRSEVTMMMVTSDEGTASTMPPVLTDADGRFSFDKLRRGNYTLTAERDGGASKATLDEVQPDADVTLELAPLGALEGRVSADGKPTDCIAQLSGPSDRVVRVRDGAFEVDRLEPGHYTVEVAAADGAVTTEVEIEAGETAEVSLMLERFSTVTGTIVDASGAPVVGAEILIASGSGGRIEVSREDGDPQYFTAEDGTFEVKAAAGGRVLIAQSQDSPMPLVVKPFVVEGGQDVDLGQLSKEDMKGMKMMGGPPGEEGGPPELEVE